MAQIVVNRMYLGRSLLVAVGLTAGLSTTVPVHKSQAQESLPYSSSCVSSQPAPQGDGDKHNWSRRYEFVNDCPETVLVRFRHNYGFAYKQEIRCSRAKAVKISSGDTLVSR